MNDNNIFAIIGLVVTTFVTYLARFYINGIWTKRRLKRKVKIGDFIEFSNGYETVSGTVTDKKFTYVVVDNSLMVPNSFISANPIKVIKNET